jgi:hypothetical protein
MVKLFGRTCNRIIVGVRQSLAQSFAETRVNASRGKRRALSARALTLQVGWALTLQYEVEEERD